MASAEMLSIEVAFAQPEQQWLYALQVPAGTTAREAVALSELPAQLPEINWTQVPLGIFGQAVADDYCLVAGDRVEIYRPLIRDPKEARRLRAAKGAPD